MKYLKSVLLLLVISIPLLGFSQLKGWDAIKQASKVLTPSQDTSKSKQSSNLAVTDEGAPATKNTNTDKKTIENPINKLKKNVIQSGTQNNTGGTTSNLAVTDEGVGAVKNQGKSGTKTTNGNTGEQPKQDSIKVPK